LLIHVIFQSTSQYCCRYFSLHDCLKIDIAIIWQLMGNITNTDLLDFTTKFGPEQH